MSVRVAYLISIFGKVQGVGLRRKVMDAAQFSGVVGWVCNMPVKTKVQLHLEGDEVAVNNLIGDLQSGKLVSGITSVSALKVDERIFQDFEIVGKFSDLNDDHISSEALERKVKILRAEFEDINRELTQAVKNTPPESRRKYIPAINKIPSEFLGEPLVKLGHSLKFPEITRSFTTESWNQTLMKDVSASLRGTSHENVINFKRHGQLLAERIGLRAPRVYQSNVPFDKVDLRPGIVVKPMAGGGSKGVFAIYSDGRIYSLGYEREVASMVDLAEEAKSHLIKTKSQDRWMVEEFILDANGEIPNDIKLLTFYGKVALIQEATRMPTRVCYWTPDGKSIDTGRYRYMKFEGTGLPQEYVRIAEEISLKIPVPFVRIDILKSKDGPVFGEFTPRPGNFHQFNVETDRFLGQYFVEARARLFDDLYDGKKFPEFDEIVERVGKRSTVA